LGKITVIISDELEQKLRKHIAKKYPTEPYGKQKEVVEQALAEYLKKE
jgi:predicted transcriptional regulator